MWVQERVEASRGSLSYHLFWWRLDRLPYMWRGLLRLDPHVVARLVAEGKVKPEDAAVVPEPPRRRGGLHEGDEVGLGQAALSVALCGAGERGV
jgi:hypothetical protein